MAKLIYAVTVTPMQSTTLELKTFEAIESNVGRSLNGGDNALVWAGGVYTGWVAGVNTHLQSGSATINTTNGDNGVWIRHSGYDYDAGFSGNKSTVANTDTLIITADGSIIARLEAGQAIFLPHPETVAFVLTDDGDPIAVEYAVLS